VTCKEQNDADGVVVLILLDGGWRRLNFAEGEKLLF